MLNLFFIVVLLVAAGAVFIYFGKGKLANRLKCRASDAHETLADAAGNAIDDRQVKIREGEKAYEKITDALVQLMTDINVNGEKVENYLLEADKFTKLAKKAKEDGNMDAAKEAIGKATVAEKSAEAYKKALGSLEAERDKLMAQREKLNSNINNAKANTAIYKARYSAAELQGRMLKSDAFGGVGNLDFSEDDEALARLEAENEARSSLESTPDSALENYKKSVDDDELMRKLENL